MEKYPWQLDYDFQFETRAKTDRLQEDLLMQHLSYTLANSPFYIRKFGGRIPKVTSVSDFARIGFTTKEDLLQNNREFLAVSQEAIVDTCFTSATVGTAPVNFWLTKRDLDRLTYNEQVAFQIAGVQKKDRFAVCVALERGFMAGLAYFLGGVALGAQMLRIGAAGPQHIWNLLQVHRPNVLIGVPSVLANVALHAQSEGENPAAIGVERILAIGESTRDKELRILPAIGRIEQLWDAPIFSTYASTEMSTSFAECQHRQGGHFRPELIYVEIVDEAGYPVGDGEIGEVAVTPLGVEGMPLLRFKTGDMSYIVNEPCACGRTTRRIGPVVGRKAQLLKYKGTNVFPNAIASIVEANPDFLGCYVEARRAQFGEDQVVAYVAKAREHYDLDKLKEEFRAGLRVVPELQVIESDAFWAKVQPEGKRKRQIFFDMRKEESIERT